MTAAEITAGTYTVSFPRGMHKADFAKCLQMARRIGTYDSGTKTWTLTVQGSQTAACVREMIDRGAEVTAA